MMANTPQNPRDEAEPFLAFGLGILLVYVVLLIAFVTLLLTILSLLAWFRPVTIGGCTLLPQEARRFVKLGIAGAILGVAFAGFCEFALQSRIDEILWPYIAAAGYMVGSLSVVFGSYEPPSESSPAESETPPALPPPAVTPTKPSFHFASWSDEEEIKP